MERRPIALLTDFGAADPYVAAMKGVILSTFPGALVVDVSHEVPRHDVLAAAYILRCVERFYPPGSVFVCVVDPGVGTSRPVLCLRKRGRLYLAPGNGLLERIAEGRGDERWYAFPDVRRRRGVSRTFHGRDVFAPAAARLARGEAPGRLARPVAPPPLTPLFTEVPRTGPARIRGVVLHVDRFGNVISNILVGERHLGSGCSARIGGRTVARSAATYDEGPRRGPFLIRGSNDLLEISVRRGNAAERLKVSAGDTIILTVR